METYEGLWRLMKDHGETWKLMETHENSLQCPKDLKESVLLSPVCMCTIKIVYDSSLVK